MHGYCFSLMHATTIHGYDPATMDPRMAPLRSRRGILWSLMAGGPKYRHDPKGVRGRALMTRNFFAKNSFTPYGTREKDRTMAGHVPLSLRCTGRSNSRPTNLSTREGTNPIIERAGNPGSRNALWLIVRGVLRYQGRRTGASPQEATSRVKRYRARDPDNPALPHHVGSVAAEWVADSMVAHFTYSLAQADHAR